MAAFSRWFAGAPLVLLLGACATAGNARLSEHTPDSLSRIVQVGQTHKSAVMQALGAADHVSFTDSGNEIWTYRHARATPQAQNFIPFVALFSRGYDVATKELVILFDGSGTVSKVSMRETQDVRRRGLLQ